MLEELLLQAGLALAYYSGLVFVMRAAGKRLAGQTTTFDLLVLISLGVVLQTTALRPGPWNALTFIVTVLGVHILLARVCRRHRRIRRLVRGAPRPLVVEGRIDWQALDDEGLSQDELLAGLRKLGFASARDVRLATLEETGHISAVSDEPRAEGRSAPEVIPSHSETASP